MSRLAKKSIAIPTGVTLEVKDGMLRVKGAKGELSFPIPTGVEVKIENGTVLFTNKENTRESRTSIGTLWSLTQNAIAGTMTGFTKVLEIEGVGYRASVEGDTLVLSLGYVNPVRFKAPEGVVITTEKNMIKVVGINKELVGRTASQIRSLKKPEPYKGKGIRYQGEIIRRKVGKKATATAT